MKYEEVLEKIHGEPYAPIEISKEKTALVLIDMQMLSLTDYLVWEATQAGVDEREAREALKWYTDTFDKAISNAQKLLNACREKGIRCVHVRILSYTGDAADTGKLHKRIGFFCPPDSKWSQWIPEVAPIDGEVQLQKTCSGAVVGSRIDMVLRNLGIENVIGVGFYTDQCVETTLRDLADCGYEVCMVTDATATQTEERQRNTINAIGNVYVVCEKTADLLKRISKL